VLKPVSPNAGVVVHPRTEELVALCGGGSMGFLLCVWGFFLYIYFPLLFLTTDLKSMFSSLWLCSFHLHNWLSLCVFIHVDKLFWRVHDVFMTGAWPGAQHSAAFGKGAWLGLPGQPP